jgi:hypothetical protein
MFVLPIRRALFLASRRTYTEKPNINPFKAIPMPGFSGGYTEKAVIAVMGPITISLMISAHLVSVQASKVNDQMEKLSKKRQKFMERRRELLYEKRGRSPRHGVVEQCRHFQA